VTQNRGHWRTVAITVMSVLNSIKDGEHFDVAC
jgi:hypothetical protein